MKRTLCLVSLAISLALVPRAAQAQQNVFAEAGLGIGAVACTFVWGTAKAVTAVVGGATAGLAYLVTGFNANTARPILQAALRGDYVVTPDHLRGRKPLTFVGRDPLYEPYPYEN